MRETERDYRSFAWLRGRKRRIRRTASEGMGNGEERGSPARGGGKEQAKPFIFVAIGGHRTVNSVTFALHHVIPTCFFFF